MNSKNILIAGGSGLIGRKLVQKLRSDGHTVRVLSRRPKGDECLWDPAKDVLHVPDADAVQVIINLSGAGIGDKRWTKARKEELHSSRIGTNRFLFSKRALFSNLELFISSSGINCYGYDHPERVHAEEDPFGNDYVSNLVKDWEESADLFKATCKVTKIRTAVVLDKDGGALAKMLPIIKLGLGSPLGSGQQRMPWIHVDDLIAIFSHVINNSLEGAYNALSASPTNREFMRSLSQTMSKPFFMPAVPSFALKLMFGEMSGILLDGLQASNEKIKSTGYQFKYGDLNIALKSLFESN
jgi:uncharacterized protein